MNKHKGEEYKLIWKDKPDFVRMAAKSNALIIPFAAVGGDDAFDIAMDTSEVLADPVLGPLARRVSQWVFKGTPLEGSDDAISPITKLPGLGLPSLVPLPKLERLYFRSVVAFQCGCVIWLPGLCCAVLRLKGFLGSIFPLCYFCPASQAHKEVHFHVCAWPVVASKHTRH